MLTREWAMSSTNVHVSYFLEIHSLKIGVLINKSLVIKWFCTDHWLWLVFAYFCLNLTYGS